MLYVIASLHSKRGNPPEFMCHCEPVTDVTGVAISRLLLGEKLSAKLTDVGIKTSPTSVTATPCHLLPAGEGFEGERIPTVAPLPRKDKGTVIASQ